MAGIPAQVFVRCGGGIGTLSVDVAATDTGSDVSRRVLSRFCSMGMEAADVWLEHNGRPWSGSIPAGQQGLRAGSTLHLHMRLRGGGGDGGSTGAESRSSYLEMYQDKKPDKVNPAEELRAKWTTCRLSGQPLTPPCCADQLGFLFNKEAVLQALMEKTMPKALSHISSLKHVTQLRLAPSSGGEGGPEPATTARNFQPGNEAKFGCPISGLEMNGRSRFVVLWKTGHVISEKALKQCPAAVEEHVGYKWAPCDVIPLNGTLEEVAELRDALLEQRAAAKAKKGKKKGIEVVSGIEARVPALAAEAGSLGRPADKCAGGKRGSDIIIDDDEVRAKKLKETIAAAPEGASKAVWASLFNSSTVEQAETYACRINYRSLR